MARTKGVSSAQAGLYVKIAHHFTRRSLGKVTGRETERMIQPLQMCAHPHPLRILHRHGLGHLPRLGLTDQEILALPNYQASPLFPELDKLVFDYAVGMSRTPVDVPATCSTGFASISTTASSWD